MKAVAIIPARGGSKRIPRKNIYPFAGIPMIAWTIKAALESQLFDDVVVSTDCEEIASSSRQYGAKVPFLRDVYNDDYTPVSKVTINVVERLSILSDSTYDIVVQLMANCPLRQKRHIIAALDIFTTTGASFQISCFPFGWMNPWWAYRVNDDGTPDPLFDESVRAKRSQDLESLYCPTGAIWIAKADRLVESGTFYGPNFKMLPIEWQSAVDIDSMDDLKMAEAVYHLRNTMNV